MRLAGYLLSALVVAASVSTCSRDGAAVVLDHDALWLRCGVLAVVAIIASVCEDWSGRDR